MIRFLTNCITNFKLRINKHKIMATVYKIELTSHWLNYHPKDVEKIIEKAMYSEDMNEVTVKAERK